MQQMVLDYVIKRNTGSSMPSNPAPVEQKPQKSDVHTIRRGIGKPLSRSTTCTNWPSQPLECAHVADRLRQRGTKGCFWWTCLDCGSRWERVEWQADAEVNMNLPQSSQTMVRSSTLEVNTHSKVPYPQLLPPPKSRSDLPCLSLEEMVAVKKSTENVGSPSKRLQMYLKNQKSTRKASEVKKESEVEPTLVERRGRAMSSGTRPVQDRARPRSLTPRFHEKVESFEIHSSEEEGASIKSKVSDGAFSVVTAESR